MIKPTIYAVVMHPDSDALTLIAQAVAEKVPEPDPAAVQSLIVEELSRLHEGVLARYGLRPSKLAVWKAAVLTQSCRFATN